MINSLYPCMYYDMAQYPNGGGDTGEGGGDMGGGGGNGGGNGGNGGNGNGTTHTWSSSNVNILPNLRAQSSSLTPEISIIIPTSNVNVEYINSPGTNTAVLNNSTSKEFIYNVPFSGNNNMTVGMFKVTTKEGYYFNNIMKPHIKIVNNSNYKVVRSNDIYNDNKKLISRSFTIYCDKDNLFNFNGTDRISFNITTFVIPKPRKLEILDFYPIPQITNTGPYPKGGDRREIVVVGIPGAKFSVKLIDSDTNYSILNTPYENVEIPSNGKFMFEQFFPNSLSAKKYYMDIIPGLDTVLHERMDRFRYKNKDIYDVSNQFIFHQYPNISVKFTKTNDTLLKLASPRYNGTLTLSGTDIILNGRSSSGHSTPTAGLNQRNAVRWTVSSSKAIYINGSISNNNWLSGPTTKEMIDGTLTTKNPTDYIKTVTKKVENSDKVFLNSTKDLVVGMISDEIPRIRKNDVSVVYYETADPYNNDKLTDKLQLKSISVLKCGMHFNEGIITSIDESSSIITVSKKKIWPTGAFSIEFWHRENVYVDQKIKIKSIDCNESITINGPRTIEAGTKFKFTGGKGRVETTINTDLKAVGSGTTSITISGYVDIRRFGEYDTIQSLNVEDFLTDKPNVYTQQVKCPEGTVESNPGIIINLITEDGDGDVATKTVTIVHNPTKGTLGTVELKPGSKTYTPFLGVTGTDEFVFKVANAAGTFSDEVKVYITIE